MNKLFSTLGGMSLAQKLLAGMTLVTVLSAPFVYTAVQNSQNLTSRAFLPATPPAPPTPPNVTPGDSPTDFATSLFLDNSADAKTYAHQASIDFQLPDQYTFETWINIVKPQGNSVNQDVTVAALNYQDIVQLAQLHLILKPDGSYNPQFSILTTNRRSSNTGSGVLTVGDAKTIELRPGSWHHMAGTTEVADGNCTITLFVDGIRVDKETRQTCFIPTLSARDLLVGAPKLSQGQFVGSYFHGMIDELRFSQTIVYTGEHARSLKPLVATGYDVFHYRFDNSLNDASGNGHTLNILGEGRKFSFTQNSETILNRSPIIYAKRRQIMREGTEKRLQIKVIDYNVHDKLMLTAEGLPEGLSVENECVQSIQKNSGGREYVLAECYISGTPTTYGVYQPEIVATDLMGNTSSLNFTFIVLQSRPR